MRALRQVKRRKFNNVRTTVDGLTFDSKGEAARWIVLREREEAGLISGLERQVSYRLSVNGQKIADIRPDFRYMRNGATIVEDFKSAASMTPTFRMKSKLLKALYDIDLHITFAKDDP